jgi:tetratricopeptide (TPR) repeat protein
LGIIKSKINDFDQSLQNFFYAEKIYKKLNDTSSLVKVNNNIGLIYSQLGKDSLALNSFETAKKLNTKANGNNNRLIILYGNIGEIYLKRDELAVAEGYYHKALLIIDTAVNIGAKAWILAKMGNLKLNKKEYDSCFYYTTGSIELSMKTGRLSDLHEAYGIMTSYYEQNRDYEKAFQYLEKKNAIQDSLFDEDQVKRMAMQEMRFQFEKEKDLQYLKYQAEKLRLWTVILSLIILVILVVSILIILRARQKKIRAQNEKLNIEKKQLEELMQIKSRELTSQLLQLANNNELNHQLINKLRKAKINFKRENHALIDGIISDLRINVNDSMWKPFERSFSEIHPNFFNKLRQEFPKITQKEQRLAAFLFLNLTSKEIAALTHISVSGVEMARIRLRKKLGISGTETNFSVFLAKYF